MVDYFRTCCHGALAALRSVPQQESVHQQARRKQIQQLKASAQDFVRSNPVEAFVPELLSLSTALHKQHEFGLALTVCCQTSLDAIMAAVAATGDSAVLVVLKAEAQILAAKNVAALILANDIELTLADSVSSLISALSQLQAAMQSMLPNEHNHWLVYQGARTIKEVCSRCRSIPGKEMLQFLAFAALSLETNLTFSLPEYLSLRVELYLALVTCQQSAGMSAEALTTIQQGQAGIAAIEKLEQLDPLPPSPEAQTAYQQARTRLNTAQFAITAASLPTEQAVSDALQSMLLTEGDRLAALAVSLMPVPPSRVVQHQPCPAGLVKLVALAETLVKPHLAHFNANNSVQATPVQSGPELNLAKAVVPLGTHQVSIDREMRAANVIFIGHFCEHISLIGLVPRKPQ